ncbi:hypothetical protein AB2L27_00900 [Kineococcus sp. LSe6-4]|uniref:VTT domain-containing protein n=1 Tax=Kineococcus halophytocola TaxID=3234027 RepID=A0ABV4GVJ7_9ACTN
MNPLVGSLSLLGVSFVSALTPFVNAEAALVASQALEDPLPWLPAALAAAVGQMGAKYLYFRLGYWRSSTPRAKPLPRWQQRLADWSGAMLTRGRWRGVVVLALSSSVGLPPLLLVSVSAGLARMRTADFLVVGVLGRAVRFAAVLLGAGQLVHWLHVPGLG